MFESYEKRRESDGRPWKTFGVVAALFAAGVWLCLHFWRAHEAGRAEARHREFVQERTAARTPQKAELPGMSVTTPGLGVQSGDYEHGLYTGGEPIEFAVQWMRSGSITRAETLNIITSSYDKSNHWSLQPVSTKTLQIAGVDANEDVFASGDTGLIVTQLECGKRRVALLVAGNAADLPATNERMIASFECKPDAHRDPTRPLVVVDAVPGWSRTANDNTGVLALLGPDGEVLRTGKLERHDGSVAEQIERLIDGTAIRLLGKPTTRNDKVFWQGINAADHKPAAVLAWRCDDERVALVTIIAPTSVNAAVAVADTGRCLGDDDTLPIYR